MQMREEGNSNGSVKGKDNERWRGEHLDRCVDILRQSLICHGDVSSGSRSFLSPSFQFVRQ